MNKVAVAQGKREFQAKIQQESFAWMDNPRIQKLLDVVASIIADEYIQIAKQNPEVFSGIASAASLLRNDVEQTGGSK